MRRRSLAVAVGVLGAVLGAASAFALRAAPAPQLPEVIQADPTIVTAPGDERPATHSPRRVLLVWTAGGLPKGFDRKVSAIHAVRTVTAVQAGRVDLLRSATASGEVVDTYRKGWSVPIDAFAIDPSTFRRMIPASARSTFAALRPGRVLLGATSAELRRLAAGDRITLVDGGGFTVAGVVEDTLVGAAEAVFHARDAARIGVTSNRFMLVEYTGRRGPVESAIRESTPRGSAVRIRGPGETPYLRHGDAVLPQALLKQTFGEFAYRPRAGRNFDQEPAWQADNIVEAEVPLLGTVRCHRAIVESLRGLLRDLQQAGLDHLVDPHGYQGCWNPRLISEGGALSRHAWGIAIDLNADANPTGVGSGQDPRLVEAMERWGFTWGGFWLIPDPMHFEYLRPPDP